MVNVLNFKLTIGVKFNAENVIIIYKTSALYFDALLSYVFIMFAGK